MNVQITHFSKTQLRTDLPDLRPGDTIKVHQKVSKEGGSGKKEGRKIQIFEGQIIAKKHGNGIGATITVRKVLSGVGDERIFPIHSPAIEKIEIVKSGKARRAKLYYLREAKGRKSRLKTRETQEQAAEKETPEPEAEAATQEIGA